MSLPPALFILLLPASLVVGWLYLHKDADVEQRIDMREAQQRLHAAEIDADFARIAGDREGAEAAKKRAAEAAQELARAAQARAKRTEKDMRSTVRDSIDELIKPQTKGEVEP